MWIENKNIWRAPYAPTYFPVKAYTFSSFGETSIGIIKHYLLNAF